MRGPAADVISSSWYARLQTALVRSATGLGRLGHRSGGQTPRTGPGRSFLIGAQGGFNVGDQAMLEAAVTNIDGPLTVVLPSTGFTTDQLPAHVEIEHADGIFRSTDPRRPQDFYRLVRRLRPGDTLWITGADNLGGGYSPAQATSLWSLATASALAGCRVRVLGCSWNADVPDTVVKAARRAVSEGVEVGLRDPASYRRFRGVCGGGEQVADVVFLHPQVKPARKEWEANAPRRQLQPQAIVNMSGLIQQRFDQQPDYRHVVDGLLARGYDVCLVPHVRSDLDPVIALSARYADDPRVTSIETLPSPAEVLSLLAQASVVVTGRMHLGILALAVGITPMILETQDKVAGLAELFECPEICVPAAPGFGEIVLENVSSVTSDAAAARRPVAQQAATQLAARNFTEDESMEQPGTLANVRRRERDIATYFHLQLAPKGFDPRIRSTRHFREWTYRLMNYNRIMEIPLACELLEVDDVDEPQRILDLASPKLMAMYLAAQGHEVVASDIDTYFVADFTTFANRLDDACEVATFDATQIPYPPNSFDRVFSVSALEHIPGDGDAESLKEVGRILRPGGVAVITLPAYPTEMEEWLSDTGSVYWTEHSVQGEEGRTFFQRRYSPESIKARLSETGMQIEQVMWIAERPIKSPKLAESGRLLHNVYYIEDMPVSRALNRYGRWLPLVRYPRYHAISKRTHYLTDDGSDPNVRQVAVKFRKPEQAADEPSEV